MWKKAEAVVSIRDVQLPWIYSPKQVSCCKRKARAGAMLVEGGSIETGAMVEAGVKLGYRGRGTCKEWAVVRYRSVQQP
jgi:hypothetical protein